MASPASRMLPRIWYFNRNLSIFRSKGDVGVSARSPLGFKTLRLLNASPPRQTDSRYSTKFPYPWTGLDWTGREIYYRNALGMDIWVDSNERGIENGMNGSMSSWAEKGGGRWPE